MIIEALLAKMKTLLSVRFNEHEIWIMDSEGVEEFVRQGVYDKFDFSKKMFYREPLIWYNYKRTIVSFYGANKRMEASQCHYLITNFGNC